MIVTQLKHDWLFGTVKIKKQQLLPTLGTPNSKNVLKLYSWLVYSVKQTLIENNLNKQLCGFRISFFGRKRWII